MSLSSEDLPQQLEEYAGFVDQVLKPELEIAERLKQEIDTEIADYQDLVKRLNVIMQQQQPPPQLQPQKIDNPYNDEKDSSSSLQSPQQRRKPMVVTMVDLGFKTVFCNAVAKQPNQLFVHVGMGFHVEMTLPEAASFCAKRIDYLKTHPLAKRQQTVQDIKDHVQSATNIMNQLLQVMQQQQQQQQQQ
jgi:prefoldin subunit 5